MKKLYSLLLVACFLTAANAQIVITEIMYNPPEAGTDSLEYIEIHNPTTSAVNMDGFNFSKGITYYFNGFTLPAGGYQVLAVRASAMKNVLGIQNAIQWDMGQALSNGGEALVLKTLNGSIVDSVQYSNIAPWPTEPWGNGPSLVLCDPSKDNSDPANWSAATTALGAVVNGKELYGSPGSGCVSGLFLADDNVAIASGKTVQIPVLANDQIPGSTFAVTISSAPSHGTATLANNIITYKSTNGYCGNDVMKYKVIDGASTAEANVNIKVYCFPLYTIPQVHGEDAITGVADSANIYCELQGIVYGGNLVGQGLRFSLIDAANNGILIQNDTASNFGYTITEGDRVRCFGQIQQLRGVTMMELDTLVKISANNPLVSPLAIDVLVEETESRLVKSSNLLTLVNSAQWTTGMGPSGFTVDATDGTTNWQIRIDNDVDLWNMPPPTNPFYLIGIGSQFDNTQPFNTGYQIFPRRASDIQEFVGVNDPSIGQSIRLMPNPVSENLTIEMEVPIEKMSIHSTTGQLVFEKENPVSSTSLDVKNLKAGVWFITFQKEGNTWTTRFVKI